MVICKYRFNYIFTKIPRIRIFNSDNLIEFQCKAMKLKINILNFRPITVIRVTHC